MGLFDVLGDIAGGVFQFMEKEAARQSSQRNRVIKEYEKKLDAYEKSHPDSEKVRRVREQLQEKKTRQTLLLHSQGARTKTSGETRPKRTSLPLISK